ncbi:MAG: response regulator [Flavobacterium sp.]|nr:response regulator [Flavobacterium sp.]
MNNLINNNLNIFLTDDDLDDCKFFSDALNELKINSILTVTSNGVELMDVLVTVVPPPPYVIFLDLNLPKKNGFECLKEIRDNKKLMNIPVVVLSTSSNRDFIEQSYKYGANYYICKPKSFSLLKKSIETVLSLDKKMLSTQPSIDKFVLTHN